MSLIDPFGGSGGGVTEFTELADVPGSYEGSAGDLVAVNSAETGLTFVPTTTLATASAFFYSPTSITISTSGSSALPCSSTLFNSTGSGITNPSVTGGVSINYTTQGYYQCNLSIYAETLTGSPTLSTTIQPGSNATGYITQYDTVASYSVISIPFAINVTSSPFVINFSFTVYGSSSTVAIIGANQGNGNIGTSFSTTYIGSNGVPSPISLAFTQLSDVPSSYSGQNNKIVAVNSGATGLTFITNTLSSQIVDPDYPTNNASVIIDDNVVAVSGVLKYVYTPQVIDADNTIIGGSTGQYFTNPILLVDNSTGGGLDCTMFDPTDSNFVYVFVRLIGTGPNGCIISNSDNLVLSTPTYSLIGGSSIDLMYDQLYAVWYEMSRSNLNNANYLTNTVNLLDEVGESCPGGLSFDTLGNFTIEMTSTGEEDTDLLLSMNAVSGSATSYLMLTADETGAQESTNQVTSSSSTTYANTYLETNGTHALSNMYATNDEGTYAQVTTMANNSTGSGYVGLTNSNDNGGNVEVELTTDDAGDANFLINVTNDDVTSQFLLSTADETDIFSITGNSQTATLTSNVAGSGSGSWNLAITPSGNLTLNDAGTIVVGDPTGSTYYKLPATRGSIGSGSVLAQTDSSGTVGWVTSGGGGATTFLQLTDCPSSYSGAGTNAVVVNPGATGLMFAPDLTYSSNGSVYIGTSLGPYISNNFTNLSATIGETDSTGTAFVTCQSAGLVGISGTTISSGTSYLTEVLINNTRNGGLGHHWVNCSATTGSNTNVTTIDSRPAGVLTQHYTNGTNDFGMYLTSAGLTIGTQNGTTQYTLPTTIGTSGQVLTAGASNTTSWANAGGVVNYELSVNNASLSGNPALATSTLPGYNLPLSFILYQTPGYSAFNTSTSAWTCPVSGVYKYELNMQGVSAFGGYRFLQFIVYINTVSSGTVFDNAWCGYGDSNSPAYGQQSYLSKIFSFSAGTVLYFYFNNATSPISIDKNMCCLSITLLGLT